MNISQELQAMLDGAHTVVKELAELAEKPGVINQQEQLAALSLVEIIGSSFVRLGSEIEAGNEDGVMKALSDTKCLYDKALQIISEYPAKPLS